MKTKILKSLMGVLMCILLTFSLCACSADTQPTEASTEAATTTSIDPLWESATYLEDVTLGEGQTVIKVEIKAGEKAINVTVNTDAVNLQDALTSLDLIQGEEGEYGMYIKTVNGITADYDKDKSYWAIYKNGEYMMESAKAAQLISDDSFELVYTK